MSYLPGVPWPSAVEWGREAETEWLTGLTVEVKDIVKGVRGTIGIVLIFLGPDIGWLAAGGICAPDSVIGSKWRFTTGSLWGSEEGGECLVRPTEGESIVEVLLRCAAADSTEKAAFVADFVAGMRRVMNLSEVIEEKVGTVGWATDSEEECVVVTLVEGIEFPERGVVRGDVERVPSISVGGGINGLIVELCLAESIVGVIKELDLRKVFLGREREWGEGTHIRWGGTCIELQKKKRYKNPCKV